MKRTAKSANSHSGNRKPSGQGAKGKGGSQTDTDEEETDEEETSDEEDDTDDEGGDDEGGGKSKGKRSDDSDDAEEGDGDDEVSDDDFTKLPPKTQKYIKKLRKENQKYRNRARKRDEDYKSLSSRVKNLAGGRDDDEMSPEEQVEYLSAGHQHLEFENATLRLALSHGITGEDGIEYLQHLVSKAAGKLDEDEELDEDELGEIVSRVKKHFGGGASGGSRSTSVADGKKTNGGKKPDGKETLTVAEFAKLSVFEHQEIYRKNPDLYARLMKEARSKRLLGR